MYDAMIGSWWAVVLRGGVAALFGLLALLVPGLTLDALVTLFASYAIVDGLVALFLGRRARDGDAGVRLFLLEGVAGIALGVVVMAWNDINAFTLMLLVGLRAIVSGAAHLAGAVRLRRAGHADLLLWATGAASAGLGLVLVLLPGMGVVAVVWWIALSALAIGAVLVMLGLRLRAVSQGAAADGGMMAAA